jgi:lysophospholipase L1-like esterase
MGRAAVMLGAGAALLAVAAAVSRRGPGGASTGRRVALVGDSYAVGLGPILAKLAAADGVAFRFEGHVSTRGEQWAKGQAEAGHGAPWLQGWAPTHVLVSLGANDAGASRQALRPFYEALRDRFQAAGAQVVWLHPPRFSPAVSSAYHAIDALGVDVFHTEQLDLPLVVNHPTPTGYGTWARAIWHDLAVAPAAA